MFTNRLSVDREPTVPPGLRVGMNIQQDIDPAVFLLFSGERVKP